MKVSPFLTPLFWTSGDVSSGFQSQSGQPYSFLMQAYVLCVPRDSSVITTPADLLAASILAEPFFIPVLCTLKGLCTGRNSDCKVQAEVRRFVFWVLPYGR